MEHRLPSGAEGRLTRSYRSPALGVIVCRPASRAGVLAVPSEGGRHEFQEVLIAIDSEPVAAPAAETGSRASARSGNRVYPRCGCLFVLS